MFRSLLRFSTRDVLWLTVVVALALGWSLHCRSLESNRQIVIQHAQKLHDALSTAKVKCEQLERNIHYAFELGRNPLMPDSDMWSVIVDWTVLDEPILEENSTARQ